MSAKTPQPTPRLTPISQQGGQTLVGTPARISDLRAKCLVRDHHRCVISRKFDIRESTKRFEESKTAALDDEGNSLLQQETDSLEVAHIIPHSLVSSSDDPSKPLVRYPLV